jgi:hypothetical protein
VVIVAIYNKLIADAIDRDDSATTALVEELMRATYSTLDGLDSRQFRRAARVAFADAVLMAAAGELQFYCETLGLVTPAMVV